MTITKDIKQNTEKYRIARSPKTLNKKELLEEERELKNWTIALKFLTAMLFFLVCVAIIHDPQPNLIAIGWPLGIVLVIYIVIQLLRRQVIKCLRHHNIYRVKSRKQRTQQ